MVWEKDIWWTAGTMRGGTGHLGLTHTEPQQRGRLWTACGQRRVDNKNSQTTPATTSTSSIRQLFGAADAQTAHHPTSSTAPTHQPLGSVNAETTPARAPAAAADRKQRNMRREERVTVQGPVKKQQPDGMSHRGVRPTPPPPLFQCIPAPPRPAACCPLPVQHRPHPLRSRQTTSRCKWRRSRGKWTRRWR